MGGEKRDFPSGSVLRGREMESAGDDERALAVRERARDAKNGRQEGEKNDADTLLLFIVHCPSSGSRGTLH